ncbi:hypothetical protein [Streptomyces fulvoviolaceus]|uniref:hypothetical protein n=1 Tax=Streptomyces fulvoviolaceus TaxID=285535 RepID=UPI000AF2C5B9|nr:hypothetical protein [Streptomyces fulvoviolaceus]
MRGARWLALAGAVIVVACGRPGAGGDDSATGASPTHARFDEEIKLADGRRVGVSYAAGRGVLEQHQDAEGGAWSKPRIVYATQSNACQSLGLKAFGDTVAVIANWGYYCADGDPPDESIAAVGTAGLTHWDTKVTKDFDGWEKATADGDARRLTFTNSSTEWLTRLRWYEGEGFGEVENIRR